MSAWSGIGKALKALFKGGSGAAAAGGAGNAIANGGKIVLTWGNTIKVATVGIFSYLFLTGGASNVVSTALGIPEGVAQVLIILLFVVFLYFAIRYLVNYAKDKVGLKKEYLEEPIFQRNARRNVDIGDDPFDDLPSNSCIGTVSICRHNNSFNVDNNRNGFNGGGRR